MIPIWIIILILIKLKVKELIIQFYEKEHKFQTMEKLLFITTRDELKQILSEILLEIQKPQINADVSNRLTRRQASRFLDISYQTMYNWTRSGIVKEHGAGKKKFYLRSELMEVIRNE